MSSAHALLLLIEKKPVVQKREFTSPLHDAPSGLQALRPRILHLHGKMDVGRVQTLKSLS